MDRRQFIRRSFHAALGLALARPSRWLQAAGADQKAAAALNFSIPEAASHPQIVIAKGGSPAEMTKAALEAIGGMGRFIAKGDRVLIKPNVSWDSSSELGANTHPEIVKLLTELCLRAGARRVVVMDNTIDEPRRCFARSGIEAAVTAAGGLIQFQGDRTFRETDLGGAIGRWPVMTPLFEADKFINVPVVKSHGLSKLTATMKNLYGIVGSRRGRLHAHINESIVDLARFVRPTLVILDAYSVMARNGPSGGRAEDLIHPRTIAVGTDQVALDAYAATLLGLRAEEVGYIKLAHDRGLGNMRYSDLRVKELRVA